MDSVLDRELLFITGKGGVGKTTIAAAIGLLSAARGRRTVVVEVGEQSRLAQLFAAAPSSGGEPARLAQGLWSLTVDPDRALLEWLQSVGGRVSGRLLAGSSTFQYFAAAAPGAQELVTMVKIWQLTRGARRRGFDLVIVDGPSTGHALGLLRSPATFGAIARVGPIAGQTHRVQELLGDPARSDYLAVSLGTDMAVSETLELADALERDVGRALAGVILNSLMPRRFSAAEVERIEAAAASNGGGRMAPARQSAALAARSIAATVRTQRTQTDRLRRRDLEVLGVPFVWGGRLDLQDVGRISEQLARRL